MCSGGSEQSVFKFRNLGGLPGLREAPNFTRRILCRETRRNLCLPCRTYGAFRRESNHGLDGRGNRSSLRSV